jgi:hypothetical protein
MKQEGSCKFCGLLMAFVTDDDGSFTSYHEAPTCKAYDDVIASSKTPPTQGFAVRTIAGEYKTLTVPKA